MITGTHGIFQGGDVAKDNANSRITIAASLMRAADQRLIAVGGDGRRVSIVFGASTPGFNYNRTRLSALDAPTYQLALGLDAGEAYLLWDSQVTDDLLIAGSVIADDIVFAKVTWPAGATSMADLTIDTAERTETRIVSAADPVSAKDLYHNGMRFGDTGFNAPLASFAVMSEVLQGELRARVGDNFAVSLLRRTNILTAGTQLTVERFRLYLRDVVAGSDVFKAIDTKSDAIFNFNVNTIPNERINVFVDRTTGEVGAGTSFDPVTKVLVAFGDVPAGATSLADVFFVVASELSQANAQSGASVELNRRAYASGFVRPVALTPVPAVPQTLVMDENIVEVAGVQARVPAQQIALPSAPVTGDRVDLVYLEVHRVVEPSPPADGSTYVVLGGVGYLVTKIRLAVAQGVAYDTPEKMMLQPQVVGLGGSGFDADAQGHFVSPYFAVAHDGFSWALPVGLAYRFNQGNWAPTNLSGGTNRPDGKQFDRIHVEELSVLAPVLQLKGVNHQLVLNQAIDAILKGAHPQQLGHNPLQSSYLSKRPLVVDAVAPTLEAGAHMLGAPDSRRRQWSARPEPYWTGVSFPITSDYASPGVLYEDGTRTLLIQAPAEGSLVTDAGQPVAELTWVETGLPVGLVGTWTVGVDETAAQAVLSAAHANFLPAGTVSVSFQIVQEPTGYLTGMPSAIFRATVDGNGIVAAGPGAPVATEAGGVVTTTRPIGPQLKCEAVIDERVYVADGSDTLAIPTVLNGRIVLGAIEADVVGVGPIGIRTFTLQPLGHLLRLSAAQPNGTSVRVKLALGGRIFNYEPRHLALTEFAESALHDESVTGGKTEFFVALPDERVLKGVLGYRLNPALPLFAGVYVDGRLYQATVLGFDRNLVKIELVLTTADYNALEVPQQPLWEEYTPGLWRLVPGTYTFTLPVLWTSPIKVFERFLLAYGTPAQPFLPAAGDEQMEIVHHGRFLITNSSPANVGTEPFAPATERFPLVAGVRKGHEATEVATILSDALEMGHKAEVPWDGVVLAVDGRFVFNAGIFDPDAGFVVWMALVRHGRALRVFTYLVEGDTFSVEDPGRAFFTYPLLHVVE